MVRWVDTYLLNVIKLGKLVFVDITGSETGSDIAKMEVIEHVRSAKEILQAFISFTTN